MMRAISAIGFTMLAMLALAPCPVAAAVTYDFSATLDHGPCGDLGNTAVTGQFAIDFDTASITAFDFLMPGGVEIDGGGTGSGFGCRYGGCGANFGSHFVSGAATPAGPPPPTVPEPASLTLLGGGLVTLVAQLRARRRCVSSPRVLKPAAAAVRARVPFRYDRGIAERFP